MVTAAKAAVDASGKHDEAAVRGPVGTPSGEWTQELVNQWCPPQAHILLDSFSKRWRIHYFPHKDMSRSWNLHGYESSLLQCLQKAWISYWYHRGVECPIQGIFHSSFSYAREVDAPDEVLPSPAADASAGPARGAGRGRRGRGRGPARGRARGKGVSIVAELAADGIVPEPSAAHSTTSESDASSDSQSSRSSDSSSSY